MERSYDIVVYGATGITGQLVAFHLALHAPQGLRWTVAGRSQDKLEGLLERINQAKGVPESGGRKARVAPQGIDLDCVVDTFDPQGLQRLAQKTKVVLTTVGPYATYGEALLRACAQAGTHYADLTGEIHWVLEMAKYDTLAKENRAIIVHAAGWDSVPCDLGSFLSAREVKARFGDSAHLGYTETSVKIKGGLSGGTIASLFGLVNAIWSRPRSVLRAMKPYSNAATTGFAQKSLVASRPVKSRWTGQWLALYPLEAGDVQTVMTSWGLFKRHPNANYGDGYHLREYMNLGGNPVVTFVSVLVIALSLISVTLIPPLQRLVLYFIPPGKQVTEESRKTGMAVSTTYADIVHERTSGKTGVRTIFKSKVGDPAYNTTTAIMAEVGIGLVERWDKSHGKAQAGTLETTLGLANRGTALDKAVEALASQGGRLSPVAALGGRLAERLIQSGSIDISTEIF